MASPYRSPSPPAGRLARDCPPVPYRDGRKRGQASAAGGQPAAVCTGLTGRARAPWATRPGPIVTALVFRATSESRSSRCQCPGSGPAGPAQDVTRDGGHPVAATESAATLARRQGPHIQCAIVRVIPRAQGPFSESGTGVPGPARPLQLGPGLDTRTRNGNMMIIRAVILMPRPRPLTVTAV